MLKRLIILLPILCGGCHVERTPTDQQIKASENVIFNVYDSKAEFGWSDNGIRPPPPKFNSPYHGDLSIEWHYVKDVNDYCGIPTDPGWITEACSGKTSSHSCTMILPIVDRRSVSKIELAEIFLHERAHCNGWNYRHNNGDDPANIKKAKELGMDQQ